VTSGPTDAEALAAPATGGEGVPAGALPMLDGLRAVAALAVLLTHVAFQTGEVVRGAGGAVLARFDAGVAVFFVLSGFLLTRPYAAGRPPAVRAYAIRRALRILPAYWVALAAVALSGPVSWAHVWLGQTYAGPLAPAFTQTWSLCTEVAFYAVLPLLARWRRAVPVSIAVTYAYVGVVHGFGLPDRALLWLPGHLDWFAVGMLLAAPRLPGFLRRAAAWPGTCWAAAGVLLWLLSTPVAGPLTLAPIPGGAALVKEAGYAVVGGLLLLPAAYGPVASGLGAVLASEPARWLGRISYGVFLWHLLVLSWVYSLTGWQAFGGRMLPVAVLTVLGSVGVAALSWVVVERPALRLADRLARRSARGVDGRVDGRVVRPAGGPAGGGEAQGADRQ
jgi:peptidoglycan/LPS O-acetylase OafA/YrhL